VGFAMASALLWQPLSFAAWPSQMVAMAGMAPRAGPTREGLHGCRCEWLTPPCPFRWGASLSRYGWPVVACIWPSLSHCTIPPSRGSWAWRCPSPSTNPLKLPAPLGLALSEGGYLAPCKIIRGWAIVAVANIRQAALPKARPHGIR
jgi:hypothetical protein